MATVFDDKRAVVIEFDVATPPNGNVRFNPTQELYRGRYRMVRDREPLAFTEWRRKFGPEAEEIPPQRLGLDVASATGFLDDPLHEPQHKLLAESIRKLNYDLPPARQLYERVHTPTWLFWMKRIVEDGLAVVIQGKLPDKIEGKPRTRFMLAEPVNGAANDLAALKSQLAARDGEMTAMQQQLNTLLAALAAKAK